LGGLLTIPNLVPPHWEEIMSMEAQEKRTVNTHKLKTITAILTAGFLTVLSSGCAQLPKEISSLKAIEPMTIEITQAGDVSGVWVGPIPQATPVPRERYTQQRGTPIRQYRLGTARTAEHPSSVCVWDESDKTRVFCVPNDRHAWIQLTEGIPTSPSRRLSPNAGKINQVYYISDSEKQPLSALAPIGTPIPIPGKEIRYEQSLDDGCWLWLILLDGSMYCLNVC
jgi:hypothetical protein